MKLKEIPNTVVALLVVGGITCGTLLLMASNWVLRIPAIVFFSFLPGYLLLEILWPNGRGPDREWRIAMTLPTSIALVGIVLLLLNYFGRYSYSIVLFLVAVLNLGLTGLALRRRKILSRVRSPKSLRFALDKFQSSLQLNGWQGILICSFLAVSISVVYAFSVSKQPHNMTEFYIFSEDSSVPFSIRALDDVLPAISFGIANHEGRTIDYTVLVVGNTGANTTELWSDSVTVADKSVVERVLDLPMLPDHTRELWLNLYLSGNPSPYRSLHLILDAGTLSTVRYTGGSNREAKPQNEAH